MPLLHKKPFIPNKHPPDLKENEEVFFCRLTLEIFRDYEEFCERIILCNSLVWSCSLTGRSHLTYQEAASSEEKVKRLLKRFPMDLRIPVLYLSSLCERRSLVELAEDVFSFVKDRYFIGETVEVNFSEGHSELVKCHVLAVNPPTKEECEKYEQKNVKNGERFQWIPSSLYRYEVERMDTGKEAEVTADLISRKKSSYTKDKNRLYIKQFVHLENGFWRLKESSNVKYGISKVKFDQIFCGNAPEMNVLKTSNGIERKKGAGPKKQETLNKYFKTSEKKYNISPKKSPKKSGEFLDRRNGGVVRKRRTKKEMEEAQRLGNKLGPRYKSSMEAKQKEREEKKEKKKNLAEFLKEWNMKREDLECEDLKDLPTPEPVISKIPNERFGDAVMIMEFLFAFRNILPVKDFFPNGITFDLVERALVENEVSGPLSDLLQVLLVGIFDLLELEANETKDTDVKITPGLVFTRGDADMISVIKAATLSEAWIRKHHSLPLSQLTVDPTTLTEVLRLHFLSSGAAPAKSKTAKWRYQARGGYCNNDDPVVLMKLKKPQLIEKLGQYNVCDLTLEEKISIINCLMEQILTYSSPRDLIEEGCEKARTARIELRSVRAAEVRKGKEEAMRLKAVKKGIEPVPKEKESEKLGGDGVARELRSGQGAPGKRDLPEILKEIRKALAESQLTPLGTDRAHRRFWIFSTIPGLFVEEGDCEPGSCIPNGTPFFPSEGEGEEDHLAYIRRLFEESSKDKENVPDREPLLRLTSPGKRQFLGEKNGEGHINQGDKNHEMERSRLICSGDYETCFIHGKCRTKYWSFYSDPSDVDQLINSLNRRGFREKKLRQALTQERDVIITRLGSCPADTINQLVLNGAKTFTEVRNKSMKQYDQAAQNYASDMTIDNIMESSLRDLILETEEKISGGALGYLDVKSRELWRKAIQNNSFDRQCKKLVWGSNISEDGEAAKAEPMDEETKKEDEESRASTPSLDDGSPAAWSGFQDIPQRPVIFDMACAILQIAQGVEHKYLKRPLGLDQKERERGEMKMPTPAMERWEKALMESTNFPQLFLYLTTLENSVQWERSAINASCRICRRMKDPESMLLCDTCNKGHHMYCLKPKLTKIPAGDWHCPSCQRSKPSLKPPTPAKKRRLFSEDSENEEEENLEDSICKVCEESGAQLQCGTCDSRLHLACVVPPMRRVPKSKWFCHDCRNASSQQNLSTSNRKSSGVTESKEEEEEGVKLPVKQEQTASNKSRRSDKAAKNVRESKDRGAETPKINGYMNGLKKHDPEEDLVEERSSRRKCSKAATAKISQFAKQLRSNNWDADEETGDDESETPTSRSRRERRSTRRSEGRKGRDLPLDNAALQEILDVLMHDSDAPPFLRPVGRSEAPDYHEIVKRPMDFGTIKHKLNMLSYTKNSDLIADAELLFDNCCLYNEEGSDVYRAGEKLRNLFYHLCKEHNLMTTDPETIDCEPPVKKARTVL